MRLSPDLKTISAAMLIHLLASSSTFSFDTTNYDINPWFKLKEKAILNIIVLPPLDYVKIE